MEKIKRKDIQIIAKESNVSEKTITIILKAYIYNDKTSWQKFLKLFFISLGVSFTTAGIMFFFAYNWADLHKFVKIGLIQGLIIVLTLLLLFSKFNLEVKNILLTGTSILVGVLFAVFGQVYQTGANAYDFFLGWTLSISIWVLISNFAPLWFIYLILINTTIFLYSEQVAHGWSEGFLFMLFFLINALFSIAFMLGKKFNQKIHAPKWFLNMLSLVAVCFSTLGIVNGVFGKRQVPFYVLITITSLLYSIGIMYGKKLKSNFYLSVIPFSIIIIITAFLIDAFLVDEFFFNEIILLFISLFVIVSVTLVIKNLINLQKQ